MQFIHYIFITRNVSYIAYNEGSISHIVLRARYHSRDHPVQNLMPSPHNYSGCFTVGKLNGISRPASVTEVE